MKKSIVASVRTLLGRASQGAERSNGSNDGLAEEDQGSRQEGMQGSVMCDTQGAPTSRAADETDCSRRRGRAGTAARLHSDCFAQSRHQFTLCIRHFFVFPRHLRRPRRSFLSPSRLLLSVPCASRVRHVPLAAAGSEAPSEPGLSPGSGAASASSTRVARREGQTVDSTRVVRWEVGGIFTG